MPGRGYSKYQKFISVVGDLVLLVLAFMLAYYLRQGQIFNFSSNDYIIILLVYVFIWWIMASQRPLMLLKRGITLDQVLYSLLRNTFIHITLVYIAMLALRFYGISRLMLLYAYGIEVFLLLGWRITYFKLVTNYRRSGRNYRNIIMVGVYAEVKELLCTLESQMEYGYKVEAIVSTSKRDFIDGIPNISMENYKEAFEYNPDEVFCALNSDIDEEINEIIQHCEQHVIRIKLFPNFKKYVKKKVTFDFLQDTPMLLIRTEPLESHASQLIKRAFDVAFALVVIVLVFSWLFPLVALLIKLESKGPVFFAQERTGKGNENFMMLKFRSMTVNNDADKIQASAGDSRITKMGRIMRKTSIDELPQFFNVLKGEMSVVGPRPHMLQHTIEYTELVKEYMVRHFVKPGITGWAQINGFRGPTPQPELMRKRVKHDVWYIENWTFLLDLVIIVRTVTNIFMGEKNAV